MPSLSYTFLEHACTSKSASTLEQITFWTLGYGGWLGVALMPLIWCLPASKTLRASLSILALPTCALVLTALFSTTYLVGLFTFYMSSAMINPLFLHSSISIVCLSVASIAVYVAGNRMQIIVQKDMEETETEMETDTESLDSDASATSATSANTDDTETTQDNEGPETDVGNAEVPEEAKGPEMDVGNAEVGEESETVGNAESPNAWRETANFEGLREAASLPE